MQPEGHGLPPFLPEGLNCFLINAAHESLAELRNIDALVPFVWQVALQGL